MLPRFIAAYIWTAAVAIVVFMPLRNSTAQTPSKIPGPVGQIRYSAPVVTKDSLPNGLQYYHTRVHGLPLVEIAILVDAGLIREMPDEEGVAFTTTHLLLAGSADRSRSVIEEDLNEQGTVVIPYTHYDYTQLYAKTLLWNFNSALELLAGAVIKPSFNETEFRRFQLQASTRLMDMEISGGERATYELLQRICGRGSVLSRKLQPGYSDIENLKVEQLRSFHDRCYAPDRTTLIVTGDIAPAFLRTMLLEHFGSWERGKHPASGVRVDKGHRGAMVLLNDTSTVHGLAYFRVGTQALSHRDPRFPTLLLLSHVLGAGRQSRIPSLFWGKSVISPTFSATISTSRECNYFVVAGSATPVVADSVVLLLRREFDAIAANGISDEELKDAKKTILSDRMRMYSANRHLQSLLKELAVYGMNLEQALSFPERIEAVTVSDVAALAKELFDARSMHTVILGNAERIARSLGSLAKNVTVVDVPGARKVE